jgi:hypothetical protein
MHTKMITIHSGKKYENTLPGRTSVLSLNLYGLDRYTSGSEDPGGYPALFNANPLVIPPVLADVPAIFAR